MTDNPFIKHFPKLRSTIIIMLLVAITPILILYLYKDYRRTLTVITDTEYVAQRAASTIASTIDAKFQETKSILSVIANGYTIRQSNHKICDQVMKNIVKTLDGYALIGAIDRDGSTYCLSSDYVYGQYSGDRSYFKRTIELNDFAGGDFQISRIAKIPTLNFGYPAYDEEGEIFAISAAALDLGYLSKLQIYKSLAPNSRVTLVDENGIVLMQYPENGSLGESILDNKLANKVIKSDKEEGLFYNLDENGVEKIVSYSKLKQEIASGHLYLYVDMPKASLFNNIGNETYKDIVFVVAILIFIMIVEILLWFKVVLPIIEACRKESTSQE